MDAQRRRRPVRRGATEAIAQRRLLALELRKAGGSYRQIARQLGVDVHTAHADIGAELTALRETTKSESAGSLTVAAEQRLTEERELFRSLSVEQLEILAASRSD